MEGTMRETDGGNGGIDRGEGKIKDEGRTGKEHERNRAMDKLFTMGPNKLETQLNIQIR